MDDQYLPEQKVSDIGLWQCTRADCRSGARMATHVVKLIGGLHARLCLACMNEWHGYVVEHPDFRAYQVLVHQLQAEIQAGHANAIAAIHERGNSLERVLVALSRAWLGCPLPTETQGGAE